jgi:hypothetical protein
MTVQGRVLFSRRRAAVIRSDQWCYDGRATHSGPWQAISPMTALADDATLALYRGPLKQLAPGPLRVVAVLPERFDDTFAMVTLYFNHAILHRSTRTASCAQLLA